MKRDNPFHKQVLYLYYLRDYKPQDICKVLDAKPKTVKQVVYRFKEEMREKYAYNRA